jgi:hypothetical protein|tara:strand:+ start:689 stop:865 length:177 start_codon:yes stop_codon:yes gene_type:complete
MKQGDLVVHNKGTIHPHKKLVGIVVKIDKKYKNFYEVYWYTTGNKQSIHHSCLNLYEE